jgi:hypothetical protein
MATLKIEGVLPALDGDYDLDISKFNGHELRIIKDVANVRANELRAAAEAGDYDLVISFAMIALRRKGIPVVADTLLEADVGAITIDYTPVEVEERPPASASPTGIESRPGGSDAPGEPMRLSGGSLSNGGDPLLSRPSPTGQLGSATFVEPKPAISAT